MDAILKWAGGATAAVVLGLAGLATGGASTADSTTSPSPAKVEIGPSRNPQSFVAQKIAADMRRAYTVRRVLPIEGPIRYGEWHWDDAGVPAGPLLITVDLEARVISIFRNGFEIGAAAVMLGTDDHPTPLGTFPILSKEKDNVSEYYDNAPMPWTLRLTPDGIAIHGGHTVENGYASHGCIAVPNELASRLFEVASVGDKVVITKGRQAGRGQSML